MNKLKDKINAHAGLSKSLQNSCQTCFFNGKIFEDQDLINTQNQTSAHRQKMFGKQINTQVCLLDI